MVRTIGLVRGRDTVLASLKRTPSAPLVVHGAIQIEPTESESKESLDRFIREMAGLAQEAKAGETARFAGAPYYAPRRRLDETRAARKPVLRWTKAQLPEAAE